MTKVQTGYTCSFIVLMALSFCLYAERSLATGEGDVGSFGEMGGSFVSPYTDPNFAPTVGPAYGPTTGGSPIGGVYSPDPGPAGSNPSGGGKTSGGNSPSSGPSGGGNASGGGKTSGGNSPSSGPSGGGAASGGGNTQNGNEPDDGGINSGGPDAPWYYTNYNTNSTTHTEYDSRRTKTATPSNATTTTHAGQDSRRTTTTTHSSTTTTSVTQRVRDGVVKAISAGSKTRGNFSSSTATSTPQTKLLDAIKGALEGISPIKPITGLIESIFTTIGKVIASAIGNHASSTQPYVDFASLRAKWTSWDGNSNASTSRPRFSANIGPNASSSNATTSLRYLIMNSKPNTTNSIIFEIKAVSASSTILYDWQDMESLSVPAGTQIFLRWSAADYAQCLPFLNDNGRYALTTTNRAMKEGNTEISAYDITESNYTYRIECGGQRNGEYGVDTKSIQVIIQ